MRINKELQDQIKARQEKLKARKKNVKRSLAPVYPIQIERGLVNDILGATYKPLKRNVPNFKKALDEFARREYANLIPTTDAIDDPLKTLLTIELFQDWDDYIIADIIETRFKKLKWVNVNQISRQFKSLIGVTPYFDHTIADDLVKTHLDNSVRYITKLRQDVETDLANAIARAHATGLPYERAQRNIWGFIDKGVEKVGTKAKLIMRDQISSLNGSLSQDKNQQAGVTHYRWRTVKDARVRGRPGGEYPNARPSHWHREGEVFAWDEPPDGGHPGHAIQCRCWAEPIFSEDED